MKKTDERLRHQGGSGRGKEKKAVKRQAVALTYQPPKHNAPQVTAKGEGFIADRIIELARKNNIPVHDNPDLVQVLSQLELGDQIPDSVYQVVAEIFAFIYHLNKCYREEKQTT